MSRGFWLYENNTYIRHFTAFLQCKITKVSGLHWEFQNASATLNTYREFKITCADVLSKLLSRADSLEVKIDKAFEVKALISNHFIAKICKLKGHNYQLRYQRKTGGFWHDRRTNKQNEWLLEKDSWTFTTDISSKHYS